MAKKSSMALRVILTIRRDRHDQSYDTPIPHWRCQIVDNHNVNHDPLLWVFSEKGQRAEKKKPAEKKTVLFMLASTTKGCKAKHKSDTCRGPR